MTRPTRLLSALAVAILVLGPTTATWAAKLAIARIYIEFNASANDLGFHVFLDGEDWKDIAIVNPGGTPIFMVEGSGPYAELGMTELFFEGAEPSLDDVPLNQLLGQFPEGRYRFTGSTVDDVPFGRNATLSHAVPAAPVVSTQVVGNSITISWLPVASTPSGFPARPIDIVGYQVIVDTFQVTLPDSSTQVTLPLEFAASLGKGTHLFEVLAIDVSGNQTITEGSFVIP
ncbi:hypothetical protein [Lysobacter sp. CFH 32150]|uniref:hypothetical protein n=1 Tax=Lysobacter sp. CFH 32150 TaxID=2927128 RepID=UPI001FA7E3E7|nr:hypothetical protein [Lysobacter sp. CFH 32150]MCI4568922.1 hypothetical protein [Lysobacter sp. CFH 32150]